MRRRRPSTATIIALCVLFIVAGAGRVSQATAAPPRGPLLARIAHVLEASVRHDARRRGSARPIAVQTTRGCCGGEEELAVYYRAKPSEQHPYGGYALVITSEQRTLQQISITEETTATPFVPGTAADEFYAHKFTIMRGPPSPAGRWSAQESESDMSCGQFPPPARGCIGGARARGLVQRNGRARLMAFFADAMTMIKRARQHAPVPRPGGWPIDSF